MLKWFFRILVVVTGILLLGTGMLSAGERVNLVKNSSFEEDADNDGVPDNWTRYVGDLVMSAESREYDSNKDKAVVVIDKRVAFEGNCSVKTQCSEKVIVGLVQKIPVKGEAVYLFSLRCKSQKLKKFGEGAAVQFIFDKGNMQYIDLTMLAGSKDWLRAAKLVKLPEEATEMTLALYGLFNGAGTSWFDEVKFMCISGGEE